MNTDEMIQPVSGSDCVTGEPIAVVHADDCRVIEDALRQLAKDTFGLAADMHSAGRFADAARLSRVTHIAIAKLERPQP